MKKYIQNSTLLVALSFVQVYKFKSLIQVMKPQIWVFLVNVRLICLVIKFRMIKISKNLSRIERYMSANFCKMRFCPEKWYKWFDTYLLRFGNFSLRKFFEPWRTFPENEINYQRKKYHVFKMKSTVHSQSMYVKCPSRGFVLSIVLKSNFSNL